MFSLSMVCKKILDNFLHEDTVISFGSHSWVGTCNTLAYLLILEECCTTSSLTADSWGLLTIPRDHSLNNTESFDNLMLSSLLVGEELLSSVKTEIQDDSSSEEWIQSVLLELIRHDWSVWFASWSNGESLLGILDRVMERLFGTRDSHRSYAETTTK